MATDAKTGQPIFGRHSVGVGHVGSYQVSGRPYLTGGVINNRCTHKISFPSVTKSIMVKASGSGMATNEADGSGVSETPAIDQCIRLHFDRTGSGFGGAETTAVFSHHNYFTLENHGDSVTLNVKCKEMYITSMGEVDHANGFELIAELTSIPTSSMYTLTGSGINSRAGEPGGGY